MHRKSRFWVVSTGWLLIAVGCDKVDDVELTPGTEAPLRIEAELANDSRPCTVHLSRRSTLTALPDSLAAVRGATVALREEGGSLELLREIQPGYYAGTYLTGRPNYRYTLTILVDGEVYPNQTTRAAVGARPVFLRKKWVK